MADDSQPPAKKMRFDFDDLLTIGPSEEHSRDTFTYQVPRNLICARSKLAAQHHTDKILRTEWYHNAHTFCTYIQLLYTGEVVLTKAPNDFRFGEVLEEFRKLLELVEDFQDVVSLNLITDGLVRYLCEAEQQNGMEYEALTEELAKAVGSFDEDPFRKALLTFAAHHLQHRNFRDFLFKSNSASDISRELLEHHYEVVTAGDRMSAFASHDLKEFHVGGDCWD